MAALGRERPRRFSIVVLGVRVRSVIDEDFSNRWESEHRGSHQRRRAVLRFAVHLSALRQQNVQRVRTV